MRLGISTASFFPRLATEETLGSIARLGVETVEVFLQSSSEYEPEFIAVLRQGLRQYGLRVLSVHAMTSQFEGQLFSRARRQRADAWAVLEKVLAAAEALEAPLYVFHGQLLLARPNTPVQPAPGLVEDAQALVARCAASGLRLAWENVSYCSCRTPEFVRMLGEAVPGLGFTLDVKQAAAGGQDPFAYLEAMGERLAHVHLCDFKLAGGYRHRLPGEGEFDFARLFARLRSLGYGGAAVMELYTGDAPDDESLRKGLDYLEAQMKLGGQNAGNVI